MGYLEALLCVWTEDGPAARRRIVSAATAGHHHLSVLGSDWKFGWTLVGFEFFAEPPVRLDPVQELMNERRMRWFAQPGWWVDDAPTYTP